MDQQVPLPPETAYPVILFVEPDFNHVEQNFFSNRADFFWQALANSVHRSGVFPLLQPTDNDPTIHHYLTAHYGALFYRFNDNNEMMNYNDYSGNMAYCDDLREYITNNNVDIVVLVGTKLAKHFLRGRTNRITAGYIENININGRVVITYTVASTRSAFRGALYDQLLAYLQNITALFEFAPRR